MSMGQHVAHEDRLRRQLFPRLKLVEDETGKKDEPEDGSDGRDKKNYVFLIGGPTGAGKSSIVEQLSNIRIATRDITREKREGETIDTHLTKTQFDDRVRFGHYLFTYSIPYSSDAAGEPAWYGFPRSNLTELEQSNLVLMLGNPDAVQTAYDSLRDVGVSVVPILVIPDSLDDLVARLSLREIKPENRAARVTIAKENARQHLELARKGVYGHVIHNNNSKKMKDGWEQHNENLVLTDALVRSTTTRIDVAYARLLQVINFYNAVKEVIPSPIEPHSVLRFYAEASCVALFGRSIGQIRESRGVEPNDSSDYARIKFIMDDIRYRLKMKEPVLLNVQGLQSDKPLTFQYLRETYSLADIEVPRRRQMILHLNRKVKTGQDEDIFDDLLRIAVANPLGGLSVDKKKRIRSFSLTDRCYNHDWYSRVIIPYGR